jgi:hypothetical protein
VHEAEITTEMIFPARKRSVEVLHPRKQPFDLPAPKVAVQTVPVLSVRFPAVVLVRRDQLDTIGSKRSIQRITVVGAIPNQSGRRNSKSLRAYRSVVDHGHTRVPYARETAGLISAQCSSVNSSRRPTFAHCAHVTPQRYRNLSQKYRITHDYF